MSGIKMSSNSVSKTPVILGRSRPRKSRVWFSNNVKDSLNARS